ncbi:MAG TPA: hypothetical protein VF763_10940 [Candidatus Limnocylindrales bacterium]
MSEFGDRLRAQRDVLRVVNAVAWTEELFGLSNQAIRRWMERNDVPAGSEVARQLRLASERLGFLANRSQSQVTDDYRQAWQDVQNATEEIEDALRSFGDFR